MNFGIGDGLVAAEGVAEAEDAAAGLHEMRDRLAGIGTGFVFGRPGLDCAGGQRPGSGPIAGFRVFLIPGQGVAFDQPHRPPAAEGWIRQMGGDIVLRCVAHGQAVARDPRGHRGEKGIGG